MTDDELRAALDRARALADTQPEPYREAAFRVLLERFLGAGARPARAVNGRTADPSGLPEFLASLNVDSHPARVTAIAYYHFHTADGAAINTRDIIEGYTRARLRRPQNIPDVVATCVRRGHLVDKGRKDGLKAWVITRTGDQFVRAELAPDVPAL